MEAPAITVKNLVQTNYLASITDPPKASVKFLNSYFDETGKIHTFQISVLEVAEPSRQLVMGALPKFEFSPLLNIHIWAVVLPGKTIAQALQTRRNMIDEVIRVLRVFAVQIGYNVTFLAKSINVTHVDELQNKMRRLHTVVASTGIYLLPFPPAIPFGPFTIDPATGENNSVGPADEARKTPLFVNNRYWMFYMDKTTLQLVYRTSADGATWGAKTTISNVGIVYVGGSQFDVYWDGTFLHYSLSDQDPQAGQTRNLRYRRGVLNSDGTISWSAVEQIVQTSPIAHDFAEHAVRVDSNGFPFITYEDFTFTPPINPIITKSSTNNGTWVTATGYPLVLNTVDGNWWTSLEKSLNGDMYAVYYRNQDFVWRGKYYNASTTTWGVEETITGTALQTGISLVADSTGIFHIAYKNTSGILKYLRRTAGPSGTWGAEETIFTIPAGDKPTSASLCLDGTTGDLYSFFCNKDKVYYKRRASGGSWNVDPILVVDESIDRIEGSDQVNGFDTTSNGHYTALDRKVLFSYNTLLFPGPYKMRFVGLKLPP